jgi:drug/metabolite transporter (DMT)-like permease
MQKQPAIKTIENTHITKAVILATFGALFLALMALLAKYASKYTSESITVFFRFFTTAIYILVMLQIAKWRGKQISLKTKHLGMHTIRALASTCSAFTLFYSLRYIPLVDANLLTLTYPLFAVLLTALFFKDKIRPLTWLAMAIGFVGIVLVLKPSNSLFQLASFIGLFSGFCAAIGILGIRELSKYEHAYTIMFYYTITALITSGILALLNWQTPDWHTVLLLVGVGISGTLYQELLTRALAYAPTRIPSSLMYLSVVFSAIFGIALWHHVPSFFSWLGIGLVCMGNILVIAQK